MNIPQTPRTIIFQLVNSDKMGLWNGAWRRFFDIYHAPIKIMIVKEFNRQGWYDVPMQVVDDVISDVVISLNQHFRNGKHIKDKGRFRFLLKRMCMCRAIDYMRKNYKHLMTKPITDALDDVKNSGSSRIELETDELQALKYSMIMDAYETIRTDFSPRTCMAFEMIKLEHMTVENAVEELGVSANSINNAVYRIMKKLKEIIYNDENAKELYPDE